MVGLKFEVQAKILTEMVSLNSKRDRMMEIREGGKKESERKKYDCRWKGESLGRDWIEEKVRQRM